MADELARLEERFIAHHETTIRSLEDIHKQLVAMNGRTRALEQWRAMSTGALGIISIAVMFALGIAAKML